MELYTIAITRLNTGFQNIGEIIQKNADELQNNNPEAIKILIEEIKNTTPSFKNSAKDFNRMYLDIVDSLNQKEVNYNEYEPFFKYINQIFPQYQESLVKSIGNLKNIGIDNSELDQAIADLDNAIMEIVNTFTNLLKIAIDYITVKIKLLNITIPTSFYFAINYC